jgi:hypothetical protein
MNLVKYNAKFLSAYVRVLPCGCSMLPCWSSVVILHGPRPLLLSQFCTHAFRIGPVPAVPKFARATSLQGVRILNKQFLGQDCM